MATVRRRGDARTYFLDVVIEGKRQRIPLDTTERRQAMLNARERLAELEDDPSKASASSIKLYAFLDLYVKYSLTLKKSQGTLANERSILKEFRASVPDRKLEKFGARQADEFFMKIGERSRKRLGDDFRITGHGKNLYLRTLRMIWNVGQKWKLVRDNPFNDIKKFSTDSAPARVLTDDEVQKVLAATRSLYPDLEDYALFYLFTGMRRNEALDLRWEQVNFVEGYITILRAKHSKFRLVPLFDVARSVLMRRLPLRSPFAGAPNPSTITHRFAEIFIAAGIPHAKLHDLRKTFGTMLARHNVSPMVIMQWLGHTNSAVTMNHYIGMDTETVARLRSIGSVETQGTIMARSASEANP